MDDVEACTHFGRKDLAFNSSLIFVRNHRPCDSHLLNPYYARRSDHAMQTRILGLLLIRFPHPKVPLSESGRPFPSKTTLSPISFNARFSRPLPSPSPNGSPESSNKALKDSMWGVTNSFRMLYVVPSFGGTLKEFSRARVLNVG